MDYQTNLGPVSTVTLNKQLILNPELTIQAVGTYALLAAMPDKYSLAKLSRTKKNGTASIKSAIKELQEAGYLKYSKDGSEFELREFPIEKKIKLKEREKPETVPRETLIKRNEESAKKFKEELEAVYQALKSEGRAPDMKILKDFLDYWTAADSLKPEKKLRFQREEVFNIKLRLLNRVKMLKKWEQDNENRKNVGRL